MSAIVARSMPLLAIDTGIDFGWAYFEVSASVPKLVGVFTNKAKLDWEERVERSCCEIYELLEEFKARHCKFAVALEWPRYFESASGEMVAKRGDLCKLAYCAGAYGRVAVGSFGCKLCLVPVNEWKGQLPKPIVEWRIVECLGPKNIAALGIKSHAWDAVGIGLYLRGVAFQ